MEIILDKDFATNYFSAEQTDTHIWKNFKKFFLKKVRYFKLVTNYSSFEEMRKDEFGLYFLELFADKLTTVEYNQISSTPKWIENHIREKGGFRIYLVEFDVKNCAHFRSNFGYEFISTKNLEVIWKKYLTKEIEKSVDAPPDPNDETLFNSWRDLKTVSLSPTNSIIIVDKYILCDKQTQRIQDNLIPALANIIPENYHGQLDIIILSEEIVSNQKTRSTEEKAKEVYDQIRGSLSNLKSINFKLKILIHSKAFYPNDFMSLHDRLIYTNYYTIESGQGFNLFNGKQRLCANSKVQIHFNFQPFYMKVLPRHIESLKKYIDKLKRVEVHNMFKYYPDTECKLLN